MQRLGLELGRWSTLSSFVASFGDLVGSGHLGGLGWKTGSMITFFPWSPQLRIKQRSRLDERFAVIFFIFFIVRCVEDGLAFSLELIFLCCLLVGLSRSLFRLVA